MKHPENLHLQSTLNEYIDLIASSRSFSVHNSTAFLDAADTVQDPELTD